MPRRRHPIVPQLAWATALLLVLLPAAVASAQGEPDPPAGTATDADRARAAELYDNGERLYEEGLYEEAIAAFELSWSLSQEPLLLYNIANAYERLGDLEQTIAYLNRYRVFAEPDEREALTRRVANLERRREEAAQNEESTSEEAHVEEPPDDGGTGGPGPAEPDESDLREPPPRDRAVMTPLAWTLVGVAGAGLTTGVIFGVVARGDRDDYEASCRSATDLQLCPDSSQGLYDDWQRNALLADVSFGVAGAAAVALLLVLVLDSDEEPATTTTGLAPAFGPDSAGIVYGARF